MSLTTASAGGGLGGAGAGGSAMAMAHNVNAMARQAAPQPPPGTGIPMGSGTAAPPSMAALGADLLDKSQSISLKQVRNLSRFPIVAVDLYGSEPIVSMFPPKPKDPSATVSPMLIGKIKSQVKLKTSEVAHKTLRKWLTKSRGYASLVADSLGPDGVVIDRPQEWLGARRVENVPEFVRDSFTIVNDSSSHAIAEESATSVGVTVANGTLDGTSAPQGDDYDRVVYKVRLADSKKALTVLPEEAVTLILANARHHVSRKVPKVSESDDDEEVEMEYPVAVPVPAWACNDATMEALLDATGGSGVVFQRSVAALAGALLPGTHENPNLIIERLNQVRSAKHREYQKEHPESSSFEYDALIMMVGVTADGVECTAIQVSDLQPSCLTCVFGNFKVLANVSYPHKDPISQVVSSVKEIYSNLEDIAPEADGPVGFVAYGTAEEQTKIKSMLNIVKTNLDTWEKVPVFASRSDSVSMGAVVLGAVSHGRVKTLIDGGSKPKAQLGIRVQNVAPTAVGVRMNYYGGAKNKWTPVKTIFDFDRRVPAGPYPVDVKASECAAVRNAKTTLSDEELLKASKQYEGSGGIPEREKAALEFRMQVVQKYARNGEWLNVGNEMSPITKSEGDGDDETTVACESVAVELSLSPAGIITCNLVGERESVVQATVSARNSKLRYYIGILLAILFFGGFLVKSYVEEKVFERDTRRLLAYYKHAIPGSMSDGDLHHARYVVWKYRGKKAVLWRNLEKKYGIPVRYEHEWEDYKESTEEEVVEDLDQSPEEGDEEEASKGAPDL